MCFGVNSVARVLLLSVRRYTYIRQLDEENSLDAALPMSTNLTNHSAKKTLIQKPQNSDVPPTEILTTPATIASSLHSVSATTYTVGSYYKKREKLSK